MDVSGRRVPALPYEGMEQIMKRFAKLAIAATLAMALVGCGGTAADQAQADDTVGEAITETTDEEASAPATLGGWQVYGEPASNLAPEQADIFQKATGDLLGVSYHPIAVIGQQVVAGTNYAYLCQATAVTPDAQAEWVVAVVYVDLEGNASLTGVNAIDLADLHTVEPGATEAVGAWAVAEPAMAATLPDDAQAAFDAAAEQQDLELVAQALLGTQVVSGTNYQVLCLGHAADEPYQVYDLTLYQDLEGNVQIVSMDALDLGFYVTMDVAE